MNLSVIWRLQDLMTPTMRKVNQVASSTQRVVEKANAVMSNAFRNSGLSAKDLQTKLDKIREYRDGLKIGINDREIRRANAAVDILQAKLNKVQNTGAGKAGGILSGIIPGGMKGLVAGLGAYQAGNTAIKYLGKGMDADVADKMMKNFAGNKYEEVSSFLKAYNDKYAVYSRTMLTDAAARISQNMGVGNVKSVTDIVGKLAGGNNMRFDGILTRLEQIKGTGYLQGDELNELSNNGVYGVLEQLAKFKNITTEKLMKLKEKGLVRFDDVMQTLARMTSATGAYGSKLDVVMASAKGKWLSIINTIDNKLTDMGNSAANNLSKVLDWIIRFMEKSAPIGRAFDSLGRAFNPLLNGLYRVAASFGLVSSGGDSARGAVELVTKVVNALAWVVNTAAKTVSWLAGVFEQYPWTKYAAGFLGISYALGKIDPLLVVGKFARYREDLVKYIDTFKTGFGVMMSAVNMLRNSFIALNATNPIGWIIIGVTALAGAIWYAWENCEGFRRVVWQAWEGIKYLWNGAVALVMQAWGSIQPYLSAFIQKIREVGMWFWGVFEKIKAVVLVAWTFLRIKFQTITAPLVEAFEKVKDPIYKVFNWIKDTALKFIRVTVGIATLGLSEVGIFAAKKFKIGFDQGAAVADARELARKAQDQLEQAAPKKGFFERFIQGELPGMNMPKMDNLAGAGVGKAAGITDTVTGAKSNQVTININSKIADINNYFSGEEGDESISKKITDGVLMELNRILNTGHRLALD